ncbi:MAG: hypothetical protein JNM84_24615 [Planctomycetes bacterium]|nr:hypothetical protein [Planctomycetota bacterium]
MRSPLLHALGLCFGFAAITFLPASTALAPAPDAPSLQDLAGPWQLDVSYSGIDIHSGTKIKDKESSIVSLILAGGDAVRIVDTTTLEERIGRYSEGYLLLGSASTSMTLGPEPANVSETVVIQISGQPGKLKGKGESLSFDLPSDEHGKSAIKMKQLEPR